MFSELDISDRILKAIDQMGITQPTPVQQESIPVALEGKDLLVGAETGSGKTLAFVVPLLQKLLDTPKPRSGTRGLILTPTRELAEQVENMCAELAAFTQIQVQSVCGGENWSNQVARLRKNPEILVGTPGRLKEHLERNTLDFDDLEYLVLDEADRMLDMGFKDEMSFIIDACPTERQTLLLSATLNHSKLQSLINVGLKKPVRLQLATAQDAVETITQQMILADHPGHKEKILLWLLDNEEHEKGIIFCNTRAFAEQLGTKLQREGRRIGILHGEMEQPERKRILQLFRDGRINHLIATDVAARGLDIEGVDLVINFDMARKGDEYVHRIGRSGRQGRKGLAINLIMSNEWNLSATIQRYLKVTFEMRSIAGLKGHYKGPEKVRKNGRAAGTKKRKESDKRKSSDKPKVKQRARDKKDIGKRRQPAAAALGDGNAPMMRRKTTGLDPND
ncbi:MULTISPECIES: DEAD/DEAH box helicase [unclassified Marinobacterium]|uniref:DEAD/DEAH box helicase n=1 Tax=unclassified Marinobacterium TaxID=2644139 RepID=UPI0019E5A891|nr:ATP-dependent RNA helicase SrmB [Marinobacterium sp. xm-a-152]NRP58807.1 ATP-dependent RNA helicase SrmB [Marinobacterium sp. xm-d-564]NRQ22760.1 ATP-dependent RNA helicase SrmB [Marinobacterium sp. xm-m-312]